MRIIAKLILTNQPQLHKLMVIGFCRLCICLFVFQSATAKQAVIIDSQYSLYYDDKEPAIVFAAEDLKKILVSKGITVELKKLNKLPKKSFGGGIILAKNTKNVLTALKNAGGSDVKSLGEQDYSIRVTGQGEGQGYWVIGGDRIGAMYGGIHLGEIVKAFGLEKVKGEDQSPYIAKRGIKFNIPLGERQPSHDDRGTSAQANIEHIWKFSFWSEYLDVLAKQRFNVLSLWNKHPFPSMVKLTEYPDVALDGVYNKAGKVNDLTIDQKIDLWKKVIDYAYDRGIEIHVITWNILLNGARDKHGITEDKDNEITKDYLRKSVEKLFLTYPRLAGIGITAGENMRGISDDDKEQWLWETYGKGVQDVQNVEKERHIRFIHRYWQTSFDKMESRFGQLKDGYDMGFKYARARLYSAYNPPFAEKELLPNLPEGKATWWNLRNDDIYNLRWGNPEYVSKFIYNLPKGERTAGYYWGSDRFAWGRESISKNPTSTPMLEHEKHWYSFLLWGRMGYDPDTSIDLLKGLIKHKFPSVSTEDIYAGWKEASKIIPLVNKAHWFSWDYMWLPEACKSSGRPGTINGFHDVNDFVMAKVMDGSGLISIDEYAKAIVWGQDYSGTTPFEVAEMLQAYAKNALEKTEGMDGDGNIELSETIGDIRAMAHLGNYYAKKISGATNHKMHQLSNREYRYSKHNKYQKAAISDLEEALISWQEYAKILDRQYKKMNISIQGVFDWHQIEEEVKRDIKFAIEAK